jgi:hypothetical protein
MKKAFIPKSLRPSVVGSKYDMAAKKQIILRDELSILKILDLKERSKIIRHLFRSEELLSTLDSHLIDELKSCLIKPSN